MVNESTKAIEGFDPDLIKMIGDKEGFQVELVNIPFDSALAGLSQCQYDAAASAITITDDRKKTMLFSDPYYSAGQIVSVGINNTDIKSKDDLPGKKVGAMIGTTGAIEAEKIQNVNYKAYDTIDLAFLDLMNGQIDAVIADNTLADGYIKQNPTKIKSVGGLFTDESYGIAVCKNKPELLDKINKGLAALKSEGKLDELVSKWVVVK
jgi:polar amino acid transport system substrate-binding protein